MVVPYNDLRDWHKHTASDEAPGWGIRTSHDPTGTKRNCVNLKFKNTIQCCVVSIRQVWIVTLLVVYASHTISLPSWDALTRNLDKKTTKVEEHVTNDQPDIQPGVTSPVHGIYLRQMAPQCSPYSQLYPTKRIFACRYLTKQSIIQLALHHVPSSRVWNSLTNY